MSSRAISSSGADPTASLAITAITVTVAGTECTVPAVPASVWLEVLLGEEPNLADLFPGLGGEEAEQVVDDALWDEKLTVEEYNKILQDVLTVASGHPWWFTLRLCAICRTAWDSIGGILAHRNVDPEKIPLSRWVDAAYWALRELLKPNDKEQANRAQEVLEALLENPNAGDMEEFDEEREEQAFMEVMKSM